MRHISRGSCCRAQGASAAEVEEGTAEAAAVVTEEEKGPELQPSLEAFTEQEEAGEGAETPAESLGLTTSATVAEPVAESVSKEPSSAEAAKVESAETAVLSSEKPAAAPLSAEKPAATPVPPPVAVSFTEEIKGTVCPPTATNPSVSVFLSAFLPGQHHKPGASLTHPSSGMSRVGSSDHSGFSVNSGLLLPSAGLQRETAGELRFFYVAGPLFRRLEIGSQKDSRIKRFKK